MEQVIGYIPCTEGIKGQTQCKRNCRTDFALVRLSFPVWFESLYAFHVSLDAGHGGRLRPGVCVWGCSPRPSARALGRPGGNRLPGPRDCCVCSCSVCGDARRGAPPPVWILVSRHYTNFKWCTVGSVFHSFTCRNTAGAILGLRMWKQYLGAATLQLQTSNAPCQNWKSNLMTAMSKIENQIQSIAKKFKNPFKICIAWAHALRENVAVMGSSNFEL